MSPLNGVGLRIQIAFHISCFAAFQIQSLNFSVIVIFIFSSDSPLEQFQSGVGVVDEVVAAQHGVVDEVVAAQHGVVDEVVADQQEVVDGLGRGKTGVEKAVEGRQREGEIIDLFNVLSNIHDPTKQNDF